MGGEGDATMVDGAREGAAALTPPKGHEVHPSDMMLPDPSVAELEHKLRIPSDALVGAEERAATKTELLKKIKDDTMSAYYVNACEEFGWTVDQKFLEEMKSSNAKELAWLDEQVTDAEDNYGRVEARDALFRKAHYYCRIGDYDEAIKMYAETFDKTVGGGSRLDVIHTLVRMGLCTKDEQLVKRSIERAKSELERGGDWERMNKLKVYEALHLISIRKFSEASNLLLDSIATFTATEITSFESFIFHAIIVSMLILERPKLKSRIIESPEVLQVVANDPDLKMFLTSFYNRDYTSFMKSLIPLSIRVRRDRYLGHHYRYFIRNIRLRAYRQFLEPFKSVTLESMSRAFGVPQAFIEEEVSSFVAGGRLNSKIDRVNGVIESDRAQPRDALFFEIIKEGDALLNKIQKLSRVIDV